MNRQLALWLERVDAGNPRALSQLDALHSAIGGVLGSVGGLAIGVILIRPILYLCGLEGEWQ